MFHDEGSDLQTILSRYVASVAMFSRLLYFSQVLAKFTFLVINYLADMKILVYAYFIERPWVRYATFKIREK